MSDKGQKSQDRPGPFIAVLRWIVFLPAAILAAALAQFVANILNTWSMHYVLVEPQSFLGKIWILFIGNVLFGAVLVFVGGFVAPAHKRVVAASLAGLLLVGTGAVVVLAVLSGQYSNIFAMIASNIGGIGAAIAGHRGEVPADKEPKPQRHNDKREERSPGRAEETHGEHKSLTEKAEDAPIALRILIDVVQRQLEQAYPQVMLLPRWSAFQMAGTVAGCVALAVRLRFELPEDQRTPLELAMRRILTKRFPKSEQAYGDCYRFVTENMGRVPRSERGQHLFALLAMWTLAAVSEGQTIQDQEFIAARVAEAYQNETAGFWAQSDNNVTTPTAKPTIESHVARQTKEDDAARTRVVKNKWRHGKANFDLSQVDPRLLAGDGIIPIPAVLDPSVGQEIILLLIDHTPFIHQLARVNPFNLQLKPGCAKTTHGPIMFFLFTVPNPVNGQPFVQIDSHANPFEEQHVRTWRTLANQSHWHLFLVDASHEQVGFYEFPNTYDLNSSLDLFQKSCRGMPHDDFNAAKREFSRKYTLEQLSEM